MDVNEKLEVLEKKENRVLKEAEAIEASEERIREHEQQILEAERRILRDIKGRPVKALFIDPGLSRREIHLVRTAFVRRLAKHKIIYALVITLTFVLIWRGVWHTIDETPYLQNPLVSLGVGVFLVWVLRKATDLANH